MARNRSTPPPPKNLGLVAYQRGTDAIEYLMEQHGFVSLSKPQFAEVMAARYGRRWLNSNGLPDRRLVEEVCTLTREQDRDSMAREQFAGLIVAYSPTAGGINLIDPSGSMSLPHMLHLLQGDLQAQQRAATVNLRRLEIWKALERTAMQSTDFDLVRLSSQCENEIAATGFVSGSLVSEFLQLVRTRDIE